MRIYIASSWRNTYFPDVVHVLRDAGHEVYDFRNPPTGDPGFHWTDVDADCANWTAAIYKEKLSHPLAEKQFHNDLEAMEHCDACVLVLPCGRSAHTEAGWFAGREVPVFAYIPSQESFEPELMYKLFKGVCTSIEDLVCRLNLCDYSYVFGASQEVIDRMVEICVKAFDEIHAKSLDDVYGDTNQFDCGELPNILFSNTDKLALLNEGVAYYEDSLGSRFTELEIDKVIDRCSEALTQREIDVINARREQEYLQGFDFENEVEAGMRRFSDISELSEIATIFAHQGIVDALSYKYEETSAKETIPFHQENYFHTKYLTFGDALRDYIDYCSGIFSPDWSKEDDMSAAMRFMEYWKLEKLRQEEVRGNYG